MPRWIFHKIQDIPIHLVLAAKACFFFLFCGMSRDVPNFWMWQISGVTVTIESWDIMTKLQLVFMAKKATAWSVCGCSSPQIWPVVRPHKSSLEIHEYSPYFFLTCSSKIALGTRLFTVTVHVAILQQGIDPLQATSDIWNLLNISWLMQIHQDPMKYTY